MDDSLFCRGNRRSKFVRNAATHLSIGRNVSLSGRQFIPTYSKIRIVWGITPCTMANSCWRFGKFCCLHLQGMSRPKRATGLCLILWHCIYLQVLNIIILILYRVGNNGRFLGVGGTWNLNEEKNPDTEIVASGVFVGFLIYTLVTVITFCFGTTEHKKSLVVSF